MDGQMNSDIFIRTKTKCLTYENLEGTKYYVNMNWYTYRHTKECSAIQLQILHAKIQLEEHLP